MINSSLFEKFKQWEQSELSSEQDKLHGRACMRSFFDNLETLSLYEANFTSFIRCASTVLDLIEKDKDYKVYLVSIKRLQDQHFKMLESVKHYLSELERLKKDLLTLYDEAL